MKKKEQKKDIVFFDGDCALCNKFVRFGLKHLPLKKIRWEPLQGEMALTLLPPLYQKGSKTLVFYREGKVFIEAQAIFLILKELKWPWRILYLIRFLLPPPLASCLYRLVSRYRRCSLAAF